MSKNASYPQRTAARLLAAAVLVANFLAAGASGTSASPAAAAARSVAGIEAAAPLGSVITATLSLDNTGQPAATAQLYEAWAATPASAASLAGSPPLRVPLPNVRGPIAPALAEALAEAPGRRVDMLLYLADQADLSAAASLANWNARGAAVVATLQRHAARSQAGLLAELRRRGAEPRSFWIVNAIGVTGDQSLAQWAASQAGVALVAPNTIYTLGEPALAGPKAEAAEPVPAASTAAGGVAWGVAKIRAPSVWADWGVRGQGIVVANIDTGVSFSNTALLESYRGWSPNGIRHDYNWFDPAGEPAAPAPVDGNGHGTHTLGILAGGAAGDYTALGVAPGARWIAVRGCAGVFCADETLLTAAQWLLAPTDLEGKNPRPDLRPHIVSNSWGKFGSQDWYTGYVAAWNAAGMFAVFAQGNAGSVGFCSSTSAPANYPDAFAVGATDGEDVVADFSGRGPTVDQLVKPELTAPGVAIPSAWPDGSVQTMSGTSQATPHVAGVAALLWSANPALIGDIPATRAALIGSAVPRATAECAQNPAAVPNNAYGWGRVDARTAVQAVRVDVPWLSLPMSAALPANGSSAVDVQLDARQVPGPGEYEARVVVLRNNTLATLPVRFVVLPAEGAQTVTGRLTDQWSGAGVYGQVQIGQGPLVQTDAAGYYTATLPAGRFPVTAVANGYLAASGLFSLPEAAPDFALMPDLPHLVLEAPGVTTTALDYGQQHTTVFTVTNAGTRPLSLTASVPPLEWVIGAAGAASAGLYDLSAAATLSLTDDSLYADPLDLGFLFPAFGGLHRQVFVSSNGWVSFSRPNSAAPWADCLPAGSLPNNTLAPLWTDLDPGQGGTVRAGRVDADTFVVSYERVPPFREKPDPNAPTLSFQVALHADGRAEFIYGDVSGLPARWSVGMFFDRERAQKLACHRAPEPLSGRSWSMRNQPAPADWLKPAAGSLVLAPGETGTLAAQLAAQPSALWLPGPYTGVLRLNTNDPGQAVVDLPFELTVKPPAHRLFFPLQAR